MPHLYPLQFEPVFRQYIWGGRRLASVLNKPIGGGNDFAESWEVVDHGEDQSRVANGPLAGKTLREIVAEHNMELFGRHAPLEQFPLLFKLLDCNRNLSVQVHPNDAQGAKLDPPDLGKTEAWVILATEPGSVIYAGLNAGVDRETLANAVERGETENCLHKIHPQAGECVFIPAGTVHALGEGLLVAEIQQASDTTFRLFDWNRVGADGKSRPLHVEQSLNMIDFDRGPVQPQTPKLLSAGVQRLVECDKFLLDRRTITAATTIGGDERFHIVNVIAGEVNLAGKSLALAQTALIPASCGEVKITTDGEATCLDMYLP